ncbi:HxlR family transcriptional regulator [Vibrio natriegens]|jgi:DNA-binding HxlR family transcriptional regulator|uniref:winged helix-turn-helix transcriptional regulator n=1 Tax=Vibrio TaxID=662 RepID=UPI00031B2CC8|nr:MULTISPECIES: helix-turn-helix domain-containing protein [Vibrio]ANQ19332.1 HxlR family transcriptional regulator [Vibrio natriegens]ANQ24139.1 HxlR family transcriptional regulator [Vibrio natriegens]ANQ29308.1 HxlR family transcriptional regulator [Vibrio natriegens]MCY9878735.1 helix-turn-helix domain-containing protein [Vibrio natriegens]
MSETMGNLLSEKFSRGNVLAKECPSRSILQDVTSRWGVLVLFALLGGTHRFSELRKKITGVSEKMLSQTLQALEADGFVLRTAHPVVPPHVEYCLTDKGTEVAHKVEQLVDWIESNLGDILNAQQQYDEAKANN